jgi:hypothetical protein
MLWSILEEFAEKLGRTAYFAVGSRRFSILEMTK